MKHRHFPHIFRPDQRAPQPVELESPAPWLVALQALAACVLGAILGALLAWLAFRH